MSLKDGRGAGTILIRGAVPQRVPFLGGRCQDTPPQKMGKPQTVGEWLEYQNQQIATINAAMPAGKKRNEYVALVEKEVKAAREAVEEVLARLLPLECAERRMAC